MKLAIVSAKKAQLNASNASVSTIETPSKEKVNNKDFSGVPEAEAQKKSVPTTVAHFVRKTAEKKSVKSDVTRTKDKYLRKKSEKESIKAEVTEVVRPSAKAKAEPKKTTPKFTLVDYSEKCIALFGDTKEIKDELKKLGGRFNANLRPFDEETRVPGWVFQKKCREDLLKLIK